MDLVLNCPHCFEQFIINTNEINCGILRHGLYKESKQQIPPHASKQVCENLIKESLVIGCTGPFRIIKENDNHYKTEICDYI